MGDFQISTGHRAVGEVCGNWAQGDFVHVAPISERKTTNLTKTENFCCKFISPLASDHFVGIAVDAARLALL